MALCGFFLTKQSAPPFGNVYAWLYDNFPGFNLFREPSKFFILTSIGISILIASTFQNISAKLMRYQKIVMFIIFTFILSINALPLVTQSIGHVFIARNMHYDYYLINNHIREDSGYSRHLWVPRGSRWGIFSIEHPKAIIIDFLSDNRFRLLYDDVNTRKSINLRVQNVFLKNYTHSMQNILGIHYVIVPIQDTKDDFDVFLNFGGKENSNIRQWYIDELDRLDYLEKIDIGTEELVVYENKDYKPYITVSDKINGLKTFDKLEEKYGFLNDELNNEFVFYDINKKDIISEKIYVPFEIINTSNVSELAINDLIKDKNEKSKIYVNKDKQNVIVRYGNGSLEINKKFNNNVNINSEKIDNVYEPNKIYQLDTFGHDLFVETGSRLISLKNNSEKLDLGIVIKPFDIYSVDENKGHTQYMVLK